MGPVQSITLTDIVQWESQLLKAGRFVSPSLTRDPHLYIRHRVSQLRRKGLSHLPAACNAPPEKCFGALPHGSPCDQGGTSCGARMPRVCRMEAQLCTRATSWLLKAPWPQTLLLSNLATRREIHWSPILSSWAYSVNNVSLQSTFHQRTSKHSSTSYSGKLSLCFPAQIPHHRGTNWLNRGKQQRYFKYKMAQRTTETGWK